MKSMRNGVIGALVDIYEVTLDAFLEFVLSIEEAIIIAQWSTADRFSSIQEILQHACSAGFSYASYISEARGMEGNKMKRSFNFEKVEDIEEGFNQMFSSTLDALNGLYDLTEPEVDEMMIPVWGDDIYPLEWLLEHAIVHLLRHQRQIKKFL